MTDTTTTTTEAPEEDVQRVKTGTDITKQSCPGCGATAAPIVWHGDGESTYEIWHKPGCTRTAPKEPAKRAAPENDGAPSDGH